MKKQLTLLWGSKQTNLDVLQQMNDKVAQDETCGVFPGGPGVKTSPSNAESAALIPGQGTKILQPCGQKKKKTQNIKNRSNVITNSIKTFKMVHIKKMKHTMK